MPGFYHPCMQHVQVYIAKLCCFPFTFRLLWCVECRVCIVLYCIVLHCIALYCIVLYCIVLYCIVLCVCSKTNENSVPGQQTSNTRKKKKKRYASQVRWQFLQ